LSHPAREAEVEGADVVEERKIFIRHPAQQVEPVRDPEFLRELAELGRLGAAPDRQVAHVVESRPESGQRAKRGIRSLVRRETGHGDQPARTRGELVAGPNVVGRQAGSEEG